MQICQIDYKLRCFWSKKKEVDIFSLNLLAMFGKSTNFATCFS